MTNDFVFQDLLRIRLVGKRPKVFIMPRPLPVKSASTEYKEVTIHLCSTSHEVSAANGSFAAGFYKGVPWAMRVLWDENGNAKEVHFHANPVFVSFLVNRMVILPLLRQKLVEEGGFATLGSVFTWHGRVFFIHGIPGSGKSRTALQALELGAEFVGDNEIFEIGRASCRERV